MVFLDPSLKLGAPILEGRSRARKIGGHREVAMKNPRIILWDELPGVMNYEPPASWKKRGLAADGYQSEPRTASASFQAFGPFRDQGAFEN
jgi:hypothetical protein